mgnify:CR=1 FL=1
MNTSPQQLPRGLQKPLEWAEDTNQATRVDGPSESAAPSGALALASCWALRSLADHLAKVTSTVRTHGGHGCLFIVGVGVGVEFAFQHGYNVTELVKLRLAPAE